jgi:hypothetical protein
VGPAGACEIGHPNYHGEVKYCFSSLKMDLAQMNWRYPEAELPGSAVLSGGSFQIIRYGVGDGRAPAAYSRRVDGNNKLCWTLAGWMGVLTTR